MSRYNNRTTTTLDRDQYRRFLEERGRTNIIHYNSPKFPEKTVEIIRQLELENYVWKMGDNFYNVAANKYGDKDLWWVIAWYNEKPSDAYMRRGELIKVPRPVETIVSYFYSNG